MVDVVCASPVSALQFGPVFLLLVGLVTVMNNFTSRVLEERVCVLTISGLLSLRHELLLII